LTITPEGAATAAPAPCCSVDGHVPRVATLSIASDCRISAARLLVFVHSSPQYGE
jgi:hypothetical protein